MTTIHAYLGIDGGGTRTRAAIIGPDRQLLGTGEGGPSNIDDVGEAAARDNIGDAVDAARDRAGLPRGSFEAAFLGMAGVTSERDRAVIRRIALSLSLAPQERIGVDHDCRIALAGGLSGRPGIVQIIGTGSSTYGRTADGTHCMAGGRGHLVSDEGSGYWYGLQAIRAAIRHHDGRGPQTVLLPQVLDALAITDIDGLMHRLYVIGVSRAEIASLAPLAIKAAEAGDAAAQAMFEIGARDLAECIAAVAHKLGFDAGPHELALTGGLSALEVARRPLIAAVNARLPECTPILGEQSPSIGAALLALESDQRE